MTIQAWLKDATDKLTKAGIDSARLDSLIMLEEVLGKNRTHIVANDEQDLQAYQHKQLELMLDKRLQRMPLAYITGVREFYGLDFRVDESVLIPRPETESLVEYAIKHAPKNATVLELGTGSGAIAVALHHNRPDLQVTATDVSEVALIVAEDNAIHHEGDITFIQSNLFDAIDGRYDVVAANLPYVPVIARRQPEIEFEPDVSLYGGQDGLDYYRRFLEELHAYVRPTSIVLIEFGPSQYAKMRELCAKHALEVTPITEYIYYCKPTNSREPAPA